MTDSIAECFDEALKLYHAIRVEMAFHSAEAAQHALIACLSELLAPECRNIRDVRVRAEWVSLRVEARLMADLESDTGPGEIVGHA